MITLNITQQIDLSDIYFTVTVDVIVKPIIIQSSNGNYLTESEYMNLYDSPSEVFYATSGQQIFNVMATLRNYPNVYINDIIIYPNHPDYPYNRNGIHQIVFNTGLPENTKVEIKNL